MHQGPGSFLSPGHLYMGFIFIDILFSNLRIRIGIQLGFSARDLHHRDLENMAILFPIHHAWAY